MRIRARYGFINPFWFEMYNAAGTALKSDVALTAGDAQYALDTGSGFGAFQNVTTLPTAQSNGLWIWDPVDTGTETRARRIKLKITNAQYFPQVFTFETVQHPSALWPDEGMGPDHVSAISAVTAQQATLTTPLTTIPHAAAFAELRDASDVVVGRTGITVLSNNTIKFVPDLANPALSSATQVGIYFVAIQPPPNKFDWTGVTIPAVTSVTGLAQAARDALLADLLARQDDEDWTETSSTTVGGVTTQVVNVKRNGTVVGTRTNKFNAAGKPTQIGKLVPVGP